MPFASINPTNPNFDDYPGHRELKLILVLYALVYSKRVSVRSEIYNLHYIM